MWITKWFIQLWSASKLLECLIFLVTAFKLPKAIIDFDSFTDHVTEHGLKSRVTIAPFFVGFTDVSNQQVSTMRAYFNGLALSLFHGLVVLVDVMRVRSS